LAAEDRCHLNGLAVRDGNAAWVTATSRSDVLNGWRARRAQDGNKTDIIPLRTPREQLVRIGNATEET
jgi:hypothetical protein